MNSYDYTGLIGPKQSFIDSKNEMIIVYGKDSDLQKLHALEKNPSNGFDIHGFNQQDRIARLFISNTSSISAVVDILKQQITLNGWMPAMIEQNNKKPHPLPNDDENILRYFLPSFLVQLKDASIGSAFSLIEDPPNAGWGLKVLRKHLTAGYFAVSLPEAADLAPGKNLFDTLKAFEQKPEVKYVYYDEVGFGDQLLSPNDDYYPNWHLVDTTYDDSIHAGGTGEAWSVETGVPQVVIAIVDSGIKSAHEEFTGRISFSQICDGSGTIEDSDANSHGTIVAGVAAGSTNNSRGVAGVAGGNNGGGCTIMPVKVNIGDASPYSTRVDGINQVKTRAKNDQTRRYIMNLSWKTSSDNGDVHLAIQGANDTYTNGGGNVLTIAAAWNDNVNIGSTAIYPASYSEVIPVGAYKRGTTFSRHNSSNYGNSVVMAPGENIPAPTKAGNATYTTTASGTSVAAAIVSGIAGLVWSRHYNLNSQNFSKSNSTVRNWILSAAAANDITAYACKGRAHAKAAVDNAV